MLKIRQEQMEVFQPLAEASFVRRLAEHLRSRYADAEVLLRQQEAATATRTTVREMPDETLQELVRHGIARARSYGLSHESTLAAFVAIMFAYAPSFDAHVLARHILNDPETPPDARIDRLLEEMQEQHWTDVKESYEPEAWSRQDEE